MAKRDSNFVITSIERIDGFNITTGEHQFSIDLTTDEPKIVDRSQDYTYIANKQDHRMGYVVFQDGGAGIWCGASEEWYATYEEAMKEAMRILEERIHTPREGCNIGSVIVYKAEKSLLYESHFAPDGEVVFYWNNFFYPKH